MFSEVVNKECCLRSVTAQAGQVFNDDRLDLARFDHLIDFVDALTVEVHTADLSSKDSPTTSWPLLTAKLYMIFRWLFREFSSSSSSLDSR